MSEKEEIAKRARVADLLDKSRKREITSHEVKRQLEMMGLTHKETWLDFVGYPVWFVLCFLPALARYSGLGILGFFAQLPTIEFPMELPIWSAVVLFAFAVLLEVYVSVLWRVRRGGMRSEDNTIVLLKDGPYGIVRHPSVVIWTVFLVTAPIMLSGLVAFTFLSVLGIAEIVGYHYYMILVEERKLNIPKWGDEYVRYMREVPRFNFILGMWRLSGKKVPRRHGPH